MPTNSLQSELEAKKHDLLSLIRDALEQAGLPQLDVDSIRLNTKKGPIICPKGQTAVWGPVRNPDGSTTLKWVCK